MASALLVPIFLQPTPPALLPGARDSSHGYDHEKAVLGGKLLLLLPLFQKVSTYIGKEPPARVLE